MANQYLYDLTDTWNNVATTFDAIKMNVTDTTSAAGSLLLNLQVGGSAKFTVQKDGAVAATGKILSASGTSTAGGFRFVGQENIGMYLQGTNLGAGSNVLCFRSSNGVDVSLNSAEFRLQSSIAFGWASGNSDATSCDLTLARDAANALAQRRGTNAQTFRVYNTSSSSNANYERGKLEWASDVFRIGTEKGGTGTNARAMEFQTDGTTRLTITETTASGSGVIATGMPFAARSVSSGVLPTNFTQLAGLYAGEGTTDNTAFPGLKIFRSRAGSNINATSFAMGGVDCLAYQTTNTWTLSAYIRAQSTQAHSNTALGSRLYFGTTANDATSATERLAIEQTGLISFGGSTSSFPALKRDSTTLKVRLADDSANAALESASLKTDAPAGGTAATWKLGAAATVTPTSPNRTIEVDIGGTIYYVHAKTTND